MNGNFSNFKAIASLPINTLAARLVDLTEFNLNVKLCHQRNVILIEMMVYPDVTILGFIQVQRSRSVATRSNGT